MWGVEPGRPGALSKLTSFTSVPPSLDLDTHFILCTKGEISE